MIFESIASQLDLPRIQWQRLVEERSLHERNIPLLQRPQTELNFNEPETTGKASNIQVTNVFSGGGVYKYQRFRHPNEIRVLTLLGKSECAAVNSKTKDSVDTLRCILTHVQLEDIRSQPTKSSSSADDRANPRSASYEAVSWTWGGRQDMFSIQVRNAGDSQWRLAAVRKTMITVLERLQLEDSSRDLWVDGICIDQRHAVEVDEQVAIMANIYDSASNVCIWLGDHRDDSQLAMEFISTHLTDLAVFDNVITDAKFAKEWKALGALMSREWFSRRWAVQDLAYARKAIGEWIAE